MNRSNNTSRMIAFAAVILLALRMPASAGLVTVLFDPPELLPVVHLDKARAEVGVDCAVLPGLAEDAAPLLGADAPSY